VTAPSRCSAVPARSVPATRRCSSFDGPAQKASVSGRSATRRASCSARWSSHHASACTSTATVGPDPQMATLLGVRLVCGERRRTSGSRCSPRFPRFVRKPWARCCCLLSGSVALCPVRSRRTEPSGSDTSLARSHPLGIKDAGTQLHDGGCPPASATGHDARRVAAPLDRPVHDPRNNSSCGDGRREVSPQSDCLERPDSSPRCTANVIPVSPLPEEILAASARRPVEVAATLPEAPQIATRPPGRPRRVAP
jgi:hypothetical protein